MPDFVGWGLSALGLILTVYFSYRQGILIKPRVFVTPGASMKNDKEQEQLYIKNRQPLWAVVVGVPKKKFDTVIIHIPYLVQNMTHAPLKGNVLTISYSSQFDVSVWEEKNKKILSKEEEDLIYNTKWQSKRLRDTVYKQFSMPSIPSKNFFLKVDSIAITPQLLRPNNANSKDLTTGVYTVNCELTSDALKKSINFSFHLILVHATSLRNLVKDTEELLYAMHLRECPSPEYIPVVNGKALIPRGWKFTYKRSNPTCVMKKRWMYHFAELYRVANPPNMDFTEDAEEAKSYYSGHDYEGLPSRASRFNIEIPENWD